MPSTLSSVLQLAPTVTNSTANMAPPIAIPQNVVMAPPGGGQQRNTVTIAQMPTFPFLGPPGIQLRDREKWGYQGKQPL